MAASSCFNPMKSYAYPKLNGCMVRLWMRDYSCGNSVPEASVGDYVLKTQRINSPIGQQRSAFGQLLKRKADFREEDPPFEGAQQALSQVAEKFIFDLCGGKIAKVSRTNGTAFFVAYASCSYAQMFGI